VKNKRQREKRERKGKEGITKLPSKKLGGDG
jgi:hypothetical protein